MSHADNFMRLSIDITERLFYNIAPKEQKIQLFHTKRIERNEKMNKLYAVTVDSFTKEGESIRNSYTVVDGPYDEEENAIECIDSVMSDLEEKYKSIETDNKKITVCPVNYKTKLLALVVDSCRIIPLVRCTVIEVDVKKATAVKSTGIEGLNKRGTEEQRINTKKRKKTNQYIASLTPAAIDVPSLQDLF